MLGKIPQNSEKYQWTSHAIFKMRQYGLSEQKIRNIIKSPFRKEEGIVKKTVAVMQPTSLRSDNHQKKTWKQEIWVMYKTVNRNQESVDGNQKAVSEKGNSKYHILDTRYKIISAWRYPGVSPKRNPIPDEILREIEESQEI